MSQHDLGGGIKVTDLSITTRFAGVPSSRLVMPDPIFPELKGSLRYASGPNPAATTVGQTAMGATATMKVGGSNFSVGFKQVVFFRFHTLLYAGRKNSDGSIEETSTGLNFRLFLDCAANDNLQSPWAPFYLPRKLAPNGTPITFDIPDQPAGKARLQRRNAKRDRLNYLVSFRQSCEFVTYVVVEHTNGKHLPLEGFAWVYNHEVDVSWAKGEPEISRNAGTCRFDRKIDDLRAGQPEFDLFANSGLTGADTMVTKFNQAMFATLKGQSSPDYAITEFDVYSENITQDLQARTPKAG